MSKTADAMFTDGVTFSTEVRCTYCNRFAIRNTAGINGNVWYRCVPCDANVGTHPGTDTPLGTFAKHPLRMMRTKAHNNFDQLWKRVYETKDNQLTGRWTQHKPSRSAAYKWLRVKLGITKDECHMALFDEAMCQRVIDLCQTYLDNRVAHIKWNDPDDA